MTQRSRPDSAPNIRIERNNLLKFCHFRLKEALRDGYFLEAIALIDSIMTDRLESILARSLQASPKFRTLGEAVKDVQKLDIELVDSELLDDLTKWTWKRNRWLHEMARIPEGEILGVHLRLHKAKEAALEGKALLARLKREDVRLGKAL